MTSVTTLLALFSIFFFGGAVLADFALAMIWGVVIGTTLQFLWQWQRSHGLISNLRMKTIRLCRNMSADV